MILIVDMVDADAIHNLLTLGVTVCCPVMCVNVSFESQYRINASVGFVVSRQILEPQLVETLR